MVDELIKLSEKFSFIVIIEGTVGVVKHILNSIGILTKKSKDLIHSHIIYFFFERAQITQISHEMNRR